MQQKDTFVRHNNCEVIAWQPSYYEPNEIIAQKLCDSLKKEKYNAIRCDENVIPPFRTTASPWC